MGVLSAFMKGITRLNDFVGRGIALLVFVMFAFLLLEVGFRYLFNSPTVWTNELTQLLFGVYAVMSGGYIMAHRGHVNVDLIHSHLAPRKRAFLDIITSVVFFIFTLALLWFGIEMARDSMSSWETSFSAWNPPIWPVKLAIPVGTGLLVLQGLVKLLEDIAIAFNLDYYRPSEQAEEEEEYL
ncbi:tripartite ATP-independent periplasmic transporter, DctQ component [Marinobacter santoriniensis NKSG1]|uniref:TRAP transporter small permease protein n=1 Tax=Marinobacter santoriniensis NKSG1 TaxID=1288826 RepID=M7D144_9GAMM|nr:TRAP transporter small permease subunit [Marinobacter santoriniensis]EMP54458.1 tripartite ATP-independent periplasmic transporter, DctQ component [Marinobacter santoriniensis NKSG1]